MEYPSPFAPETSEDSDDDSDKRASKKVGEKIIKREAPDRQPAKAERSWLDLGKREKEDKAKAEESAPETKPEKAEPDTPEAETLAAEVEPTLAAEIDPAADPEMVSEEERTYAVQALAEARLKALPPVEAAETEADPGVAADLADQIFLQEAAKHGDLEAAEQAVADILEVGPEDLPEIPLETIEAPDIAETKPATPEDDTELRIDHRPEATAEEVAEAVEADDTATATSPPPVPPVPPAPPTGGGPVPPFGRPGGPFQPGGINPNLAPPTPAAAAEDIPDSERYHRGNPAAAAVVGGIIGYFIGRRVGRIRSERKLLPIQKKLEKQVTNLNWQLQEKEKRIRRIAAEKVAQAGPAVVEALAAKRVVEKPVVAERRKLESETEPTRRRAPEAHQLHGGQRHERLGHVVVAEAIPKAARPERLKPKEKIREDEPIRIPEGKRIETLSHAELLTLSEKVVVDGSSLRQIYETHLIGERGLRRLISEHLRGGDIKKALRQEIVEREIDFERDPAMRDMAPTGSAATSTAGGAATLDKLIERAADSVSGSEEAAFFRARANYEASQQQQQQHRHRRLLDVSLISIILILLALVVLLIARHGS